MSHRVAVAYSNRRKAEARLAQIIQEDYPVGSVVSWIWGVHRQNGRVIDHGYDDRLKVRNLDTGREYWITAYRILEATGDRERALS